jgi:hypothetical protein
VSYRNKPSAAALAASLSIIIKAPASSVNAAETRVSCAALHHREIHHERPVVRSGRVEGYFMKELKLLLLLVAGGDTVQGRRETAPKI